MNVVDDTLSQLIAALTPSERAAIERHMAGWPTLESREILRMLRRKLKKKVRSRVRKLVWLA